MPYYIGIGDNETFGCIQLITKGFPYFEINCFKNVSEIFLNFAAFLFCLIVTDPHGLVP